MIDNREMPDISIRSEERDREQADLVLRHFQKVNVGKLVNVGKYGELEERVVVGGVKNGLKTGEIRWRWEDTDNMPSDVPIVRVISGDGKKYVHVVTSDVWIEKVWTSVEGIDNVPKRYKSSLERTEAQIKRDNSMLMELITDIYSNYREI